MQERAQLESSDTLVLKLEPTVGVDTMHVEVNFESLLDPLPILLISFELAKKYCKDILQMVQDLETFLNSFMIVI